jgi:hypothetical protein
LLPEGAVDAVFRFSITSLGTGLSENSLVVYCPLLQKGDRTRQHFFVRKNGFIADGWSSIIFLSDIVKVFPNVKYKKKMSLKSRFMSQSNYKKKIHRWNLIYAGGIFFFQVIAKSATSDSFPVLQTDGLLGNNFHLFYTVVRHKPFYSFRLLAYPCLTINNVGLLPDPKHLMPSQACRHERLPLL